MSPKEIYRRRASNWEYHFESRNIAKQITDSFQLEKINSTLLLYVPQPVMQIDGSIVEGIATLRGIQSAMDALSLSWQSQRLMCIWYWSQSAWNDFERQYKALEDVYEPYYLFYDADQDAILINAVSSKPKKQVQVRYKSGTSGIVVPENLKKWRVMRPVPMDHVDNG